MHLQHWLSFLGLFMHQEEGHFTRVVGFLLILGDKVSLSHEPLFFQTITLQNQWNVFPQDTPDGNELLPPTNDEISSWLPGLHSSWPTFLLRHSGDGTVLGPYHQGNATKRNSLAKFPKYSSLFSTLVGCLDSKIEGVCDITILTRPNIIRYIMCP